MRKKTALLAAKSSLGVAPEVNSGDEGRQWIDPSFEIKGKHHHNRGGPTKRTKGTELLEVRHIYTESTVCRGIQHWEVKHSEPTL